MNSRERILTTLDHREPDRVPFDLGACQVTGMHVVAYRNKRQALGLPDVEVQYCDAVQQLASIDDDVIARMNIDTRGLYPLNSYNWQVVEKDAGDYWACRDEWGITHHRPKNNGLYFSVVKVPLPQAELTIEDIANHHYRSACARRRLRFQHHSQYPGRCASPKPPRRVGSASGIRPVLA